MSFFLALNMWSKERKKKAAVITQKDRPIQMMSGCVNTKVGDIEYDELRSLVVLILDQVLSSILYS